MWDKIFIGAFKLDSDNKWIKLEVQATVNLHDKTGNVAGYLIAIQMVLSDKA